MLYALIETASGQVNDLRDVPSPEHWTYPDGFELVDATGFVPEHEVWEYRYENGEFIWHEPEPEPLAPFEVLKAIYTAMPALTVGIIDAMALRMLPYLPEYDPSQTYTVGMLAVKDGKVQRRTIGGWREVV